MFKPPRKVYPIYLLFDLVVMGFSYYFPYFLKYNYGHQLQNKVLFPNLQEYSFIFFLWSIFIIISFKRRNLYTTDRSLTIPREIARTAISVFYSGILIGAVIFFAQYKFFSRWVYLHNFLLLCLLLSLWRVIKRIVLRRLIAQGLHNVNILIVGAGKVGQFVLEEIRKVPWLGFKSVGFLDDNKKGSVLGEKVLGTLSQFEIIAKQSFVDEVIVTIPSEKQAVAKVIKEAKKMRLGLRMVPENFEEPMHILSVTNIGVIPLLTYKERVHHPADFALKRIIDFCGSLIILILFLPLFIIIAICIKLDSQGPVFYKQRRVGYKGKVFDLYKFRSMINGADKLKAQLLDRNEVQDGVIFKMRNDPRITRVGAFIRKFSLDELPQVVNVLKGDMSLVGPRPPTEDEVEKYSHIHMQRLSIRPGMTGLSQVRGRSELTFRRWVRWDLWYINNWSFGLDFLILLWTFPVVFKGKGAY